MRNLKLQIEYEGTRYCGWQKQNTRQSKSSIQEVIERTLRRILHERVDLCASGRTDAGVHALAQVAHFKTASTISNSRLRIGLNALLPDDIAITRVEDEEERFHSRLSAKGKTYRYMILNRGSPPALLRACVHFCPQALQVRRMQKEARALKGRHDFKAFCASGSSVKSTVRTIRRICVKRVAYSVGPTAYPLAKGSCIAVEIEADGFLYTMVRSIVGTLIEIGKGRLALGSMKRILVSRDRRRAGPAAPAKGLMLVRVRY